MNTKFKVVMFLTLLGICNISWAQDYKSSTESVKSIDVQLRNGSFGNQNVTKSLVLKVKEDKTNDSASNKNNADDQEWLEIKKEIERNKRKISANKNYIHTTKVIDTIFVNVSTFEKESSQLSSW